MRPAAPCQPQVVLGKVMAAYGIKGWLKVYSYTRPAENIVSYSPWTLRTQTRTLPVAVLEGRMQGKGVIVRLDGITDREAASNLRGAEIRIVGEQLPALPTGQFYWHELLMLDVINLAGERLGRITGIKETAANDVLVVEGQRRCLIPWVYAHYIKAVDLAAGELRVDWPAAE